MCQMSVVLEKNGQQETIFENASLLEVTGDGVRVSALFEAPREIQNAQVARIDFMNGTVTLSSKGTRHHD